MLTSLGRSLNCKKLLIQHGRVSVFSPAMPLNSFIMLVILDSGHNVKTAGKRSADGTIREWQYCWNLAEWVRAQLLNEVKDVEVFHLDANPNPLGGSDVKELRGRVKLANLLTDFMKEYGEETILVSIHLDASENKDASGASVWLAPTCSGKSLLLANHFVKNIYKSNLRGNRAAAMYRGNFAIIRDTQCPAVLIECAFMTNDADCEMLKTPAGERNIVNCIAQSIKDYLGSL